MAPVLLWAGLGNMGAGMCKNIVEKGGLDSPLLIYNRSVQKAKDLRDKLAPGKTEVVESFANGVSKADIILTCLSDDGAVRALIAVATTGIDVAKKLFVECSTIHPDTTEEVSAKVVSLGAEFAAAPVFGGPGAAEAGELLAVLAGPAASVAKAKPYFSGVISRGELDLGGKTPGQATRLKVLGNSFILNIVEQLAEAHVVAEKSGLGTDVLSQFIENMFPGLYDMFSKRMVSGDYHTREQPLFAVDLARKDARHAMNLAKAADASFKNVETADAHLATAQEHLGASGDMVSLYGAARKEAGLKFENDV